MPVDSSIYFQQQPIDILGNVQKGMALGQNIQDRKVSAQDLKWKNEAQAVYGLGIKQNPDGSTSYEPGLVLGGIKNGDPNNPYLQKLGFDMGQTMRTNGMQDTEIDLKKRADLRAQETHAADVANKNAQTKKLLSELNASPSAKINKLTEAEKTVDKEFGKEYQPWTAGGRDIANSEVDKLEKVIEALGPEGIGPDGANIGGVETGGLTGFNAWGLLGDRVTSDKVLKARADVQSTVMNSLRAILGAQFTEKEGERIIKNTWNEADSTENNKARLTRLVGDLRAKAAGKDAQANYYESNRTLSGYKPISQLKQSPQTSTKQVQASQHKEVSTAESWARANPNDPRAQEILLRLGK